MISNQQQHFSELNHILPEVLFDGEVRAHYSETYTDHPTTYFDIYVHVFEPRAVERANFILVFAPHATFLLLRTLSNSV